MDEKYVHLLKAVYSRYNAVLKSISVLNIDWIKVTLRNSENSQYPQVKHAHKFNS